MILLLSTWSTLGLAGLTTKCKTRPGVRPRMCIKLFYYKQKMGSKPTSLMKSP